MDIYTDYGNWKFENHEFIGDLVKRKSKTISRFTSVISVVDYLYEEVTDGKELSDDENLFFSMGFDYIYDQFMMIKTFLDSNFHGSYVEMEKCAKTINLLLYINEFQGEALDNDLDTKPLDELEEKVTLFLDKKENVDDEYFALLDDITVNMFEKENIEVHTIDEIFYEAAITLGIFNENDEDVYNSFLNNKIDNSRN